MANYLSKFVVGGQTLSVGLSVSQSGKTLTFTTGTNPVAKINFQGTALTLTPDYSYSDRTAVFGAGNQVSYLNLQGTTYSLNPAVSVSNGVLNIGA